MQRNHSPVPNEHAEDLNIERIAAVRTSVLALFERAKLPNLESLVISSQLVEQMATGMLMLSRNGHFESNKRGLLGPIENMLKRIKDLPPPAGYEP